jgi:hypothetical protein
VDVVKTIEILLGTTDGNADVSAMWVTEQLKLGGKSVIFWRFWGIFDGFLTDFEGFSVGIVHVIFSADECMDLAVTLLFSAVFDGFDQAKPCCKSMRIER